MIIDRQDPWGKGGEPERPEPLGKCSVCLELSIPNDSSECMNPHCDAISCDGCGEMVSELTLVPGEDSGLQGSLCPECRNSEFGVEVGVMCPCGNGIENPDGHPGDLCAACGDRMSRD